jgi:hypothetical protein
MTSVGPFGPAGVSLFLDRASKAMPAARATTAASAAVPPVPVKGRVVAVVDVSPPVVVVDASLVEVEGVVVVVTVDEVDELEVVVTSTVVVVSA